MEPNPPGKVLYEPIIQMSNRAERQSPAGGGSEGRHGGSSQWVSHKGCCIVIKAGLHFTLFPGPPSPGPYSQEFGGPVSGKWQQQLDTKLAGLGSLELWPDSAKLTSELSLPTPEHPESTFPRMVGWTVAHGGQSQPGRRSVGRGS